MVVTFEYEPKQKVITIHGIVCWIVCCQYRDGIVTYLIEDRLKVESFKSNEG